MLIITGANALSPFRLSQLNERLNGQARVFAARHLYVAAAPTAALAALTALLAPVDDQHAEPAWPNGAWPNGALTRVVAPRLGTLSPWASKATEIAALAGIAGVKRIERLTEFALDQLPPDLNPLYDRMTQCVLDSVDQARALFAEHAARPLATIALGADPVAALKYANSTLGLALSVDEIGYLAERFSALARDPTDVELMMFAQANSEHCRHKIFNAEFTLDGEVQGRSLFGLIKASHSAHPAHTLTAYSDNSCVIEGLPAMRFFADPDGVYRTHAEYAHILAKVETHNHPTGIAPFAGAATGAGGEIRDEAATGIGARCKAGLVGFAVNDLNVPGFAQAWESPLGTPARMASALKIMLDGPIGAAAFNNEFGRPGLAGYFRSYTRQTGDASYRGFTKPIMLAGGIGAIRAEHVAKGQLREGDALVVLGGPALLIGLGGGAASSVASGESDAELDFASVQRDNPEMQRRAQEVIDRCWALGTDNPIVSLHDVGAGGLSNALPELLQDAGLGGDIAMALIPRADASLSPKELWCNEAQERFVLGLRPHDVPRFMAIAARERAPAAVVGYARSERTLTLTPPRAIDLPMDVLFGRAPLLKLEATSAVRDLKALDLSQVTLADALDRVLALPCVARKDFLITIADRSVGGLTARDQLVGPWQVPVADVAVTCNDYVGFAGEAFALGERIPLAQIDPAAASRMALGEALLNLLAADVLGLDRVRLSANWMASAGDAGEHADLYRAVEALGAELCPALGVSIPVGKDSLSMRTRFRDQGREVDVRAPISLNLTAFAPVADVRLTLTPEIKAAAGDVYFIDLAAGAMRLGGSALAQVFGQLGDSGPDLGPAAQFKAGFNALLKAKREGAITAWHDRSDGGLLVCVLEMAFAGRTGLDITVPDGIDALAWLFNEELGVCVQLAPAGLAALRALGLEPIALARLRSDGDIRVLQADRVLLASRRATLERRWSELSHRMKRLRDDPSCADEEHALLDDDRDPGLVVNVSFDANAPFFIGTGARPKVAILREQGVNGQLEMAAAFTRAGFAAHDVHMSDLIEGRARLSEFQGLAACGGFSYGDVLGAGVGWAQVILNHQLLKDQFAQFFLDSQRFALGVCNGCQMLSRLRGIIPGAENWPIFVRNRSEQFEARLSLLKVENTDSLFLQGMAGSLIPVVVSHGEGRAQLAAGAPAVALRYAEPDGRTATRYPRNPNGSPDGLAGVSAANGRVLALMPHPERVHRTVQMSWFAPGYKDASPWQRLFVNARTFVG